MKLIISYKGKCLTLAYIRSSNNTIVGWYMPQFLNGHFNFMGKAVEKKDFHITYPRDGNAHYSYKFYEPGSENHFEKRVYFNEVVLKRFDKEKTFRDFEKQPRDPKDLDQHMVMRERPEPLTTIPLLFLFPQSGIALNERIFNEEFENCNKVDENDIIFDVNDYEGGQLNYGFYIYDKTRTDFIMTTDKLIEKKRQLLFDTVFVEGYIRVVKQKEA